MPISHEHKCIFVHIPKAGGTSIEFALDMRRKDHNTFFGFADPDYVKKHALSSNFLQHLKLQELSSLLPAKVFSNYFKFAFVRNPWDRVLSNYFDKTHSIPFGYQNVSFEKFVYKLKDIHDTHVQPQCRFLIDQDNNIGVDFVGKYENLNKDWEKVCDKLGIKNRGLPYKYCNIRKHYVSYYTKKTRKIVAETYHEDIDLFKYTFSRKGYFYQMKKNILVWNKEVIENSKNRILSLLK